MNIDQVKAGRETDALVAEVMGWTDMKKRFALFYGLPPESQYPSMPPFYSTDITAAWGADKPEWLWYFCEHPDGLTVYLSHRGGHPFRVNQLLAAIHVEWDECGTKAEAYALGRCRAILEFSNVKAHRSPR